VLCRSESEAVSALNMIRDWVESAGLTLHPTKTRIVDSRTESFAFLGYSFRGEKIYPRRESLAKFKARLVKLTSRTRPGSIEAICIVSDNTVRETTNRKAVCGKTARTVWREGSPAQPDFPTPIGKRAKGKRVTSSSASSP
jgi:hypothetical protein